MEGEAELLEVGAEVAVVVEGGGPHDDEPLDGVDRVGAVVGLLGPRGRVEAQGLVPAPGHLQGVVLGRRGHGLGRTHRWHRPWE